MDSRIIAGIVVASVVLIITLVIIFNPGAGTGGGSVKVSLAGVRLGSTGTPSSDGAPPPPAGAKSEMEQYMDALKKYW